MRKLLAFVLLITFVCGSHWKWEQTRNHTGYDVFATKANDKHDLDDNEYPMSIKKSHPSVRNDKKKWYITGYLESSTGTADMFEAVYFNYAEGKILRKIYRTTRSKRDCLPSKSSWLYS